MHGLAQDSSLDAPVNGIPADNLKALKEFLAAKRGQQPAIPKYTCAELPKECAALPDKVKQELSRFIMNVKTTRYFEPDGKPNPEWSLHYGNTWGDAFTAARKAVPYASPLDKARGAAFTAINSAAEQAERVDATGEARDAIMFMVMETAKRDTNESWRGAVEDASLDASLMAGLVVLSDIEFAGKSEHLAHAKARIAVWQKGYALYRDAVGVLYVYCKGEA